MPTPAAPVALITGATAGLGAEFARQLARWGHDLVLVARDVTRLHDSADRLAREHGIAVETLAADLSTDAGVDRVIERIRSGRPIDLVVNNAGFGTKGRLGDSDPRRQEAMVRLHVLAVHRLTEAALPRMRERRRGAIITVSSVASFLSSAGNVNYCAAKGYQRMAMESLSKEVAGSGVYVQALCPGFTRTEFHQRGEMDMAHVPASLWMSAEDVVSASLAAMRAGRPAVVIPGWKYRALVFLLRFLPSTFLSRGNRMHRRDGAT